MSLSVKLDRVSGVVDQIRAEEQLRRKGAVDANADRQVTIDEIDHQRLPGGIKELQRAAGADGLLQPAEIATIRSERGWIEALVDAVGLSPEDKASRAVAGAAEQLTTAAAKTRIFYDLPTGTSFMTMVRAINDAAEDFMKASERTAVGLADRAAVDALRASIADLGSSVKALSLYEIEGRARGSAVAELQQINESLRQLQQRATTVFEQDFPLVQFDWAR